MKTFFRRLKGFLSKYSRELPFFWKYAIAAKLHWRQYAARSVILFRLDLIGDCSMFTSTASAIRECYKDSKMTIVCLSATRPIFERLGVFDKIITVNCKPEAIQWEIIPALIREIRADAYDILLQPQISKFPLVDVLAAAVRCNRRISIEPFAQYGNSSPAWIKMTNFMYDQFIPYPRGAVSEFDYYGAFVRGACNPAYKTRKPYLPCYEQKFVQEPYYVIFPGASLSKKMWSLDRYAAVVRHICRKTDLTCVIIAAEGERWAVEDIKQHLPPEVLSGLIDLTGKTSLLEVIDIIGHARFVLSNDTSGVHIAAATNTPSVAVTGGWHYRRFLPYHIEDIQIGDKLPLVACAEMPCFGCSWDFQLMYEKNPACLEHMCSGMQADCIPAVSVEQIVQLVDQVISTEHLAAGKEPNY